MIALIQLWRLALHHTGSHLRYKVLEPIAATLFAGSAAGVSDVWPKRVLRLSHPHTGRVPSHLSISNAARLKGDGSSVRVAAYKYQLNGRVT